MTSQVHVEIALAGASMPGNVTQLQIARADAPALTDEQDLVMNVYPVPWLPGAAFIVFQPTGDGTPVHVEVPLAGAGGNVTTIEAPREALAVADEEDLTILSLPGAPLVLLHQPATP
jgi:hypothetical protein